MEIVEESQPDLEIKVRVGRKKGKISEASQIDVGAKEEAKFDELLELCSSSEDNSQQNVGAKSCRRKSSRFTSQVRRGGKSCRGKSTKPRNYPKGKY